MALAAAILSAQPLPASAHVDEGQLGIRVRWVATRVDGSQRVRVTVRIYNASTTERYRGTCRVRVVNARDKVVEAFPVRIRPRETERTSFRVELEGRSRVSVKVPHCHSD